MAIALAALVMLTGLAFVWLRRRRPAVARPVNRCRGCWGAGAGPAADGLALYWQFLDMAIALAALVMLTGLAFVWLRRRHPPARLSRGLWNRLPWMLGRWRWACCCWALPAAWLAGLTGLGTAALLAVGAWELTVGLARGGPMKHALAGAAPGLPPPPRTFRQDAARPARGLAPAAAGRPDAGRRHAGDVHWLASCECEAACPLRRRPAAQSQEADPGSGRGHGRGTDAGYAGSPSPGLPVGFHHGAPASPIVPELIEPETLWACTTCRACVQACPMLIEHVDAIVDMRRQQTLEHGAAPGKAAQALANLRETGTAGGFDLGARYHWAVDLGVEQIQPGRPVDALLIAGEGAFDMRYQRSLRWSGPSGGRRASRCWARLKPIPATWRAAWATRPPSSNWRAR